MPALNAISPEKLFRLIGTPACPAILDVREPSNVLIPASRPVSPDEIDGWPIDGAAVVLCDHGGPRSAGVAALLRTKGVRAEILEGGFDAWKAASLPTVDASKLPRRDADGRTTWVTRARPKVDRIACPWLVRRFVDPRGVFLFIAPNEVVP